MATVTKPIALDESFNTTEVTPRNIADVLAEGLSHITGRTASEVEYDNTDSGLTADNVQDALDEINGKIPTVPSVDIQTAVDEFETYNGGLLSSLKVALSPNQDLHGYAKPWVGGAGKNLLPMTVENLKAWNTGEAWSGNTQTVAGMSFTILTDDANNVIGIDENGTTSSYPTLKIFSGTLNGSYKLCKDNARCRVYVNGSQVNDGTSDYSFTASGETYDINLFTGAVTLNHQTVKPMLVLSTETDFTFAPYSNICPISGHTQVKINNGKNLIGLGTRLDGYTGENYFVTNSSCVGYYFKTSDLPDVVTVSDVGGNRAYITYFNQVPANSVAYISKDQSQQTVPKTFTVDKTAEYVHIQLSYETTDVTNIQIEEGSTATAYVPYNGYQVTVNLGGTYYSGVLDVVTGVFVFDTASVDLGTLTWTYQSNYPRFRADAPSGIKFPSSSAEIADVICECYKTVTMVITQSRDSSIGIGPAEYPYIYAHDTRYTDANAYKTAMSGVKLVYKLASPQSIQLSPTMVKALVGENHLSAPLDGQEITESEYRELFTWDEVEAYVNAHSGGGSGMNYSTNEQVVGMWIDNKPLYQKTIDFGALPNANTKDLSHGIANIDKVWISGGFAYQPNGDFANQLSLCVPSSLSAGWYFGVNSSIVRCETASDRTNYSAYVTIQYTKTTD